MPCPVAIAVVRRSRPSERVRRMCKRPPLQRAVRTPLSTATAPATPLQVESIAELEGGGSGDGVSGGEDSESGGGGGTFPFYFPASSAGERLSVADRAATPFGHTRPLYIRTPPPPPPPSPLPPRDYDHPSTTAVAATAKSPSSVAGTWRE
ncbi:hypothetical protein QTP88_004978 [Uroleucon formosanum]